MALRDNARRWLRDQFTNDPNIDGTPQEKINELSKSLPHLTPELRKERLEHVQGYTNYYYGVHQGEKQVPDAISKQVKELGDEVKRLAVMDEARAILHKYGGPPTRQTIEDSLRRSAEQREKVYAEQFGQRANVSGFLKHDVAPKPQPEKVTAIERAAPENVKSRIARGNGVSLEARPWEQWSDQQLVAEMKNLRQQYDRGIENGAPSEEMRALVARDTAVRAAYQERIQAQRIVVAEKTEGPKISMGL
jgi:hypothetical protein